MSTKAASDATPTLAAPAQLTQTPAPFTAADFLVPLGVFFAATTIMVLLVYFVLLRGIADMPGNAGNEVNLHLNSLVRVKALYNAMSAFAQKHPFQVMVCFVYTYLWKQAFSIPGSFFLNLLCGALFGAFVSSVLVCTLTTIGASICYVMVKTFGVRVVHHFFGDKLSSMRAQVRTRRQQGDLFYWCLFARIMPATPNWLLNIASPLIGVPYLDFCGSVFLGLMPYNLLCTLGGAQLGSLDSVSDLYSASVAAKLGLLALLALSPTAFKWLFKHSDEWKGTTISGFNAYSNYMSRKEKVEARAADKAALSAAAFKARKDKAQ
jgi:uncharacterized membrane protein YdjX (TVP38/TMEM64 family)